MANEAIIVQLFPDENPIEYTVASGAPIAKGALLQLSGDRTASASSADSEVFAGIAAAAKADNDDATTLAAHTRGIFRLTCGNTVTLGSVVSLSGANLIKDAITAELLTGDIIGKALEAGSASDVVEVLVGAN